MSDFRDLGYQLVNEWHMAIKAFNERPGADYSAKISTGTGNRPSLIDGKNEITQVEARLHRAGKNLGEVVIIVNYDTLCFDVVSPKHEIQSFPSANIDLVSLVKNVISELTEPQGHSL